MARDDRTSCRFNILTERERERKKNTRANITCEENWKNDGSSLAYIYMNTHIQCNDVTSIGKNLGRRQRCSFFLSLSSVVEALVYLTHERE